MNILLGGDTKPRFAKCEAVVMRCRCGNPDAHQDFVCPQARAEPQGTVAYYHRNPLVRWPVKAALKLTRFIKYRREQHVVEV